MFPQTIFRFLLELAWKRFLFKVSLVAHFSTDIFGQNFIFTYFLAAISLSICFSVFFENRSVELSLQGVCGGNVSSNIFWVEISVKICAA